MILDNKSRIVDSIIVSKNKYFVLNGADPAYFKVVSDTNIDIQDTGFGMAADQSTKVSMTSMFGIPLNVSAQNGYSNFKNTWVRVISLNNQIISDFSNESGWVTLTNYDNPHVGLVDLVKSVVDGTYNQPASKWRIQELSSLREGELLLNGNQSEIKYTFNGFGNNVVEKNFEDIQKPDILAQQEFSQYLNGLRMTPVVKNDQNALVSTRAAEISDFETNSITPRSIRNRLLSNGNEKFEVQVETSVDYENGANFKSRWIPIERRRFNYVYDDNELVLESATPLTVIQYDANLFFVGKIVPVEMQDREGIASTIFMRIFTLVFEDGT
jgi:hypothetical protein